MTLTRILLCTVLVLSLGACASAPPIHYFSLDDGRPTAAGAQDGPRVAVTQVNLPDLVDRPQLVMRTADHRLQINDQYEWAEPLRRQISHVIARDLGEALDSGRVMALPVDAQDFDVDFKVILDIQRLEIMSGQGVDLDVVWRVTLRDGAMFLGRSHVREPLETTSESGGYPAAVAAQSRALRSVAVDIASLINRCLGEMAMGVVSTDEGSGSIASCVGLVKGRTRESSR
jgi:hypothetical protein